MIRGAATTGPKPRAGPLAGSSSARPISDAEFDEIFRRILERGLPYWADPMRSEPGEINHADGGRGVYFPDPDGPSSKSSPAPTAAEHKAHD